MIITSPVEYFKGTVNRPDFLTLPQVLSIETALREMQEKRDEMKRAGFDYAFMRAFIPFYSDWHIEHLPADLTADNFPGTPRRESSLLIAWLIDEIMKVYRGEIEIPND